MWRIGFNDQLPGVDTEDYVTLALIEKYYDFKVSEVWNEIINELEHDNIKLIGNDPVIRYDSYGMSHTLF